MGVVRFKLIIPALQAKGVPPLGPILGQYQINIINFCKEFNANSMIFEESIPIRVVVLKYENKTFAVLIKKMSFFFLLKQFLNFPVLQKSLSLEKFFDLLKLDFELSFSVNFVSHTLTLLSSLSLKKIEVI